MPVVRNRREERPTILVLAPVPPPMHGAAYATRCLVGSDNISEEVEILHINACYSGTIDTLQKWSVKKLLLVVQYLWQLFATCIARRVDAVVLEPAFYFKPLIKDSIFIIVSSLILRRRTVLWFHMDFKALGYSELGWWWQSYFKFVISRAHRCVCVAGGLVEELKRIVPEERIAIIPNGIPDTLSDRKAKSIENKKRVNVLYVSNMDTAKGWKVLFEAAGNVCSANQSIEFDFYGAPAAGNSNESIEEFFLAGQHSGRVRYHGFVEGADKEAAFAHAEVFCLPSFNEAFPLTVLEAMAAGLPVIASDVGGISDALIEGEGGYLVEPGNSIVLSERLLQLCSDAGLRESMGAFNRSRYEKLFSLSTFEKNWVKLFKEIQR